MFFADCREHSTPYYNLLEILNFDNIVKFKTAVFTHKIFKILQLCSLTLNTLIKLYKLPKEMCI